MRKAALLTLLLALAFSVWGQTTLLPFGSSWRYLDNGSNQGTAWQAASFYDGGWKNGPAELGYGEGDEATVVSYGSNASAKYITTYFRSTFSISNAALYGSYTLRYKVDDGMVVYCNGREVYRKNMPTGTITNTTPASGNASDDGKTIQSTTLPATAFQTGSNVIAVEVHQDDGQSSDLSFNLEIIANPTTSEPPPSSTAGFRSITNLSPVAVTASTGEKPQSKVWSYNGRHWAVLPNKNGTYLWRLDGSSWTPALRLSSRTSSKADCKVVGAVTHIFLYQGRSSQFVSVEYDAGNSTYKLWSHRTSTVGLYLEDGVETASLDMDDNGRMWLANAGTTSVHVRWSDYPYSSWSSPLTIATGIKDDDICAVIALPGKIGVLWSNQSSKRFGFKTHANGASPSSWSADEVPASQSALNVGAGMADDHMNMAVAGDGTLYCAVKTGYDASGYPCVALLVRRPGGSWDELYSVSSGGTRPIALLNESLGKIRIAYTSADSGGSILYKESSTTSISFGSHLTLIKGSSLNNPTATKANASLDVVIMASTSSQAYSVLASDGPGTIAPLLVQSGEQEGNEMVPRPAAAVYPSFIRRGGLVTVQTPGDELTEAVLADSYGRTLGTFRFKGMSPVPMRYLAAGTYYLVLYNSQGVKTHKILVTH